MIVLVPISPEVPKVHANKIWPGLVLVIILCLGYLESNDTLIKDERFVSDLYEIGSVNVNGEVRLKNDVYAYLKLRPLLKIAPAPADWSWDRLFLANFIHGSPIHLFLNLVGAFAGARICATFMPFLCALAVFTLGGSLGLLASLFLSPANAAYVPHVGASAGIFALMGTYYVYNFAYRTCYFFWFPSRSGTSIKLRTSTFFFVDVLLVELVLTLGQLSPSTADDIDHFAHVFGFAAGMALAYFLRFCLKWPLFLQTRGEFLYWKKLARPNSADPETTPLSTWINLIEINPYNDRLKLNLFRHLYQRTDKLSISELRVVFQSIRPTFIRLHPEETAAFIKEILSHNRELPQEWLATTPYDSIIRLAKFMTNPPEEQHLLLKMITQYQKAQPYSADLERKLELLTTKLKQFLRSRQSQTEGDGSGNANASNNRPLEKSDSRLGKAKKGS